MGGVLVCMYKKGGLFLIGGWYFDGVKVSGGGFGFVDTAGIGTVQ